MGSRFPPRFYDDAMLKTLEHAFKEVCEALEPSVDGWLETVIAQKLMDLAAIGINDVDELRGCVLQSLRH